MEQGRQNNPYSNFNFMVEVVGGPAMFFSEVTGLDSTNQPIEYRDGSDTTNTPRKLPGQESYSVVSLKRGITGNMDLWQWRKDVRDSGNVRGNYLRTVHILLLDEKRDQARPGMKFTLRNAWPTKLVGPTLSAKANEIAIEQLDLVHEGLDID